MNSIIFASMNAPHSGRFCHGLCLTDATFAATEFQKQGACFFGARGCSQDCAVIVAQQLEPMVDIACMIVEMGDRKSEFSA